MSFQMTTRSLSLIEQKKLQWSKEREEMSKFYGLWAPISFATNQRKISDSCLSQLGLNKFHDVYDLDDICNGNRCLPPIQKSIFNEDNRQDEITGTAAEYNTSGYASETDSKEQLQNEKKKQWKSQSSLYSDTGASISSQTFGEDVTSRLKWGDRGVGVGHLWEPTANVDARLPEINNRPGTPHWLQRSLLNKSHLRGQNVPNEPEIIIQREQKRQKALELQEAIKQQLQERERKRKEEKEQQAEEERKLEQRVKRQQELEKTRIEEERKKIKEKEEKENKKSKMMREALATAQQLAKEAKTKNRGRVLSEIHTKINNKMNCKEDERELTSSVCEKLASEVTAIQVAEDAKPAEAIQKKMCDVHTSLTAENYFQEFKMTIPLVSSQWTQTSSCCTTAKPRKKSAKSNSERPKWGVNRSNTKYMKQSEKDPFYQRKVKYRFHRRHHQDSSRSFDSTDESKSISSSPHEKDFNMNLKLNLRKKFSKSYLTDKVDASAVNYDSDKYDEDNDDPTVSCSRNEAGSTNTKLENENQLPYTTVNSKADLLKQITNLSTTLESKRRYWEEEMKKVATDFTDMSMA